MDSENHSVVIRSIITLCEINSIKSDNIGGCIIKDNISLKKLTCTPYPAGFPVIIG